MNQLLAAKAAKSGQRFWSVGIAVDWSPRVGFDYLSEVGAFDEISAGRNWLNSSASTFLWEANAAAPSIPQVIVVERTVTVGADRPTILSYSEPRVVARKIGTEEIARWIAAGTPIR
jgi:hypothetical protein